MDLFRNPSTGKKVMQKFNDKKRESAHARGKGYQIDRPLNGQQASTTQSTILADGGKDRLGA